MLLISLHIPKLTKTSPYPQCNTSITSRTTNKTEFDICKLPVPCLALGTQPIDTECRRNVVGGKVLVGDKVASALGRTLLKIGIRGSLSSLPNSPLWNNAWSSRWMFNLQLVILFTNRGMCKAICWQLAPCGSEFKLQNSQPHLRRFKTVSFLEEIRPESKADSWPYASKDINEEWGFT
jgi:hypothetical protein